MSGAHGTRGAALSAGGTRAAGEDLDADFVARALRPRLGCDDVRVWELVQLPRGVSRETWRVTCTVVRAGAAREERLVLRRDLPGGSICCSALRSEYEVYRRLRDSGIPIAEALWYEDDPRILGGRREHYVRRHVEGDWDIPHLLDPDPRYNPLRVEIGREHVRNLARVHGCDWRALGLHTIMDAPARPADSARRRVEAVTGAIQRLQVQPLPLVAEAAQWLLDHPPPATDRICLVKGTNGYGEEIFRDGRIVAMSDWELCCLGDPAMDFALAQTFLDPVVEDGRPIWGLGPALEYYRTLTGCVIDPATVDYYRRLYGLYRVQYSQAAARQLESTEPMCRLAWVAVEVLHLGQTALANAIGCTLAPLPEAGRR